MYRHLNVTGDLDLNNLDQFNYTKNTKTGTPMLDFYNSDKWVPLSKQTGEFLAPKSLGDRFGEIFAMKNFLAIDETPLTLERSFEAAANISRELPTDIGMESIPFIELSILAEYIDAKTRESSQNSDLNMREDLEFDKTLQTRKGKL